MKIGAVITGGAIAGLWINLSGMAAVHLMLGADYVNTLLSHMPDPPGVATLVRHLSLRFALGIVGVALYTQLRPQFDRDVTAAAAAAAFLFLAGYVPLTAMLNEMAILTGWRLWATLVWSALEVAIAMQLGVLVLERMVRSVA